MRKKINISFTLLGLAAIIAAILVINFTYSSRNIRINGVIVDCPIEHIKYSTRGGNHAYILYNGIIFPAGRLILDKQIGDTITVRYLKGMNRVIQEDFEPWRFNLYFGLEGILLIMGLIIIIGGFKGKTMYDSYTP